MSGEDYEPDRRMRLRAGPLQTDQQSFDRARLPLPRLPAHYRRRVRDQHLDGKAVRREHRRCSPEIASAGGARTGPWCSSAGVRHLRVGDYHGAPNDAYFIRAGTLDKPEQSARRAHLYPQQGAVLHRGAPAFKVFYKMDEIWSPEAQRG